MNLVPKVKNNFHLDFLSLSLSASTFVVRNMEHAYDLCTQKFVFGMI